MKNQPQLACRGHAPNSIQILSLYIISFSLHPLIFSFQKLCRGRPLRSHWRLQRPTNRRDRLPGQHPLFPHIQNIASLILEFFQTQLAISSPTPQLQTDVVINWLRPRIILTARVASARLMPSGPYLPIVSVSRRPLMR